MYVAPSVSSGAGVPLVDLASIADIASDDDDDGGDSSRRLVRPEKRMLWLPAAEGGLGFTRLEDIADPAFVAGTVMAASMVRELVAGTTAAAPPLAPAARAGGAALVG